MQTATGAPIHQPKVRTGNAVIRVSDIYVPWTSQTHASHRFIPLRSCICALSFPIGDIIDASRRAEHVGKEEDMESVLQVQGRAL
jgi:hypothetical protein